MPQGGLTRAAVYHAHCCVRGNFFSLFVGAGVRKRHKHLHGFTGIIFTSGGSTSAVQCAECEIEFGDRRLSRHVYDY
jgi:hypothetical protein